MRTNYHTHTCRCGHASGYEEDYVKEAIKNNIKILGFSDHGPFEDCNRDFRMPFSEFPQYLSSIDELKEKYANDITLLKSVEIEYFKDELNFYEKLLSKYNLDYLLLGQHMYNNKINQLVTYDQITDSSYFLDYAATLVEAMDTKLFKIIAHPDFFSKFLFPWDYNCEKASYEIINSAIKNNLILEINANGIRCGLTEAPEGKRYIYPDERFWKKVAITNLKVVINSDCHNPQDLWDDSMDKAYDFAKELNIKITDSIK